jgi:hypothetical protein
MGTALVLVNESWGASRILCRNTVVVEENCIVGASRLASNTFITLASRALWTHGFSLRFTLSISHGVSRRARILVSRDTISCSPLVARRTRGVIVRDTGVVNELGVFRAFGTPAGNTFPTVEGGSIGAGNRDVDDTFVDTQPGAFGACR